nr:BRI1 kinase inhibitor 1-like [Ipomoea batatas]GMC56136.1 BRI1 kinase inhibitor 1-like [Ipomoea batatas]
MQEEPPSQPPLSSPPPPAAATSTTGSFSFTISLHAPSSTKPAAGGGGGKTAKSSPASFAVDLSPADEIFFHGHLLPLHLLSHLPVSPRSSTTSMDSFTLPIKDQTFQTAITAQQTTNDDQTTDAKSKPKSFSLFGLPKRRKSCEVRDNKEDKEKHWRKLKYDVTQAVKRYIRMVRPLLSLKGRRRSVEFHRQTHSFSGNLINMRRGNRSSDIIRGFRGEYSAPASTRTSPTNSGLLVAPSTFSSPSDSTMEELQAAIQAAIAHCKKSIAIEENIKCQEN